MTLDPTINPAAVQRAQLVHGLRHLADLFEREVLPLPYAPTHVAWMLRGDEAREQAERIAVAIGGEWQAEPWRSGDFIGARVILAPGSNYANALLDASVSIPAPPREVPRDLDEQLAAELTAASTEARENLEALNGVAITRGELLEAMGWSVEDDGAGPDLRACCDHEHTSHPDPCPVAGCDCDGDGPTVAVDR